MTDLPQLPAPPVRPADGHKGTFGTVIVVGGSTTMLGAPALAAAAALRSGVGLCRIATHVAILPFCLTIEPSATGLILPDDPAEANAEMAGAVLAVGPGLGTDDYARRLVERLLQTDQAMVLDADGLNNLAALQARVGGGSGEGGRVITPHPGEFRRLAEPAGVTLSPTDPDERAEAAATLARHHDCVVVLKGRHTIIADADRTHRNETGNVALATAGSGDVLTGLIASLIAQGMPAYEAAVLGAHVHGFAADLWAEMHGNAGLTASELARMLPQTLQLLRDEA